MGYQRVGTTEWLNTTCIYIHTYTASSCMKLHWRRKWQPPPVFLPGESQIRVEPGGLPSMGSHRVRHDWSNLAAAAAWNRHEAYTWNYLLPRGSLYVGFPLGQRICITFMWLWRRYIGKKHHSSQWAQLMWLRNLNVITQTLAFLLRNSFIWDTSFFFLDTANLTTKSGFWGEGFHQE